MILVFSNTHRLTFPKQEVPESTVGSGKSRTSRIKPRANSPWREAARAQRRKVTPRLTGLQEPFHCIFFEFLSAPPGLQRAAMSDSHLPIDEQKKRWKEICQTLYVFSLRRGARACFLRAAGGQKAFRWATLTPLRSGVRVSCRINNRYISEPFHEPVPWKELGLTDYLDVVKHPMDLGTVMNKLKHDSYRSFEAFNKDITLIFENCRSYNQDTSDVYRQANRLEKLYLREVQRKLLPTPIEEPKQPSKSSKSSSSAVKPAGSTTTTSTGGVAADRPKSHSRLPSADEKDRLCKNIFKLKPTDLGEVVHIIEQLCPAALDKIGDDEIDIDVDLLDSVGFRRADTFVKECMAKQAASGASSGGDSKRMRKDDEGE